MRILALYDIHGNIDALEAVLADPRAADLDAVVIGGDVVPGPDATATLDRLERLDGDVHWLRGNGEREVGEMLDASAPPADDDMPMVTAARNAAELHPERVRRLAALPITLELDGILFCHATPRSDAQIVTKISSPERWADALAGVTAPLVVGGHTHQQYDHVVGATRWVNAGSVGMPYEGDGAARWLWIVDGEPELRQTSYDAAATGRRVLEAGWPDTGSIPISLIDPIDPDEITRLFEARATGG